MGNEQREEVIGGHAEDHITEVWVWEVGNLEVVKKLRMPFPEPGKKGWTSSIMSSIVGDLSFPHA